MKKEKDILKMLIDTQFSIAQHNISYDYIVEHQEQIKQNSGVPWYQHYTITSDQHRKFKEVAISIFRKQLKLKKDRAEKEFGWFNLAYGLKVKDNDST